MKLDVNMARLKTVPIFKELEDRDLAYIYKIAQNRIYKPKMYVCRQGAPLTNLFILHTGKIKFFKSDTTGREQIMSILEAGEMFPYVGFFRHGKYPANAEVMKEAQITLIPINQLEKVLLSNPEMCIKLFKMLGEKIIDLQARLEEQILHNTYEKIVLMLVRLCNTNGVKYDDYFKLTTHFSNQELARMIGTSRETISRTVNQLKKKGIIKMDEDGYLIINRTNLKQELLA